MGRHKFRRRRRTPRLFGIRWQYVGILILLLVLGIWCVRLSPFHYGTATVEPSNKTVAADASAVKSPFRSHDGRILRAVYPYSVIPGGVESVQELRKDIAEDPVVRAHYSGFDLSHAHVIRLQREQLAYVSYRMGNEVYWTTHKLRLAKNEAVITDGTHTARSRCGNLVSETPVLPTSPKEPAVASLDAANLPGIVPAGGTEPVVAPPLAITIPPTAPGGPFIIPPVLVVPPGGGSPPDPPTGPGGPSIIPPVFVVPLGDGPPPDPPVTALPEPPTVLLLLISLPLLWMLGKRTKRSWR